MNRLADAPREIWRAAARLPAATALLAIAGCGGTDSTDGSNSSSTVAETITNAALIEKGVKALAGQEVALKKVALPPIGTEIDELAALGAPRRGQAEVARILGELGRALKAVARDPGAVLGFTGGPFAHPDKLAARYGFEDCARAL